MCFVLQVTEPIRDYSEHYVWRGDDEEEESRLNKAVEEVSQAAMLVCVGSYHGSHHGGTDPEVLVRKGRPRPANNAPWFNIEETNSNPEEVNQAEAQNDCLQHFGLCFFSTRCLKTSLDWTNTYCQRQQLWSLQETHPVHLQTSQTSEYIF